jgi:DNA-binding transcriptional ArsR family regulator
MVAVLHKKLAQLLCTTIVYVMEPVEVNLDAQQIRVLAHPLRARLLAELRRDGPATATRLAEALGTNTGATSYHLRQLADVGLVIEEEGAGRGRERWWRAAHDLSSWKRDAFAGDPDAVAAADWLENYAWRHVIDSVEAWQRAEGDESPEWREAADRSDYMLHLNPAQLTAMTEELHAVVQRYFAASEADPAPDARAVYSFLYHVPRVDPT